jgi:transcriptional regulator with XRE-family HTH domain
VPPNVDPAAEFGAELRRRRADARLTQEQLAERSGLSARTVRDLERGRVRYPRPESLRLLAEVLGLAGADLAEFEAIGRHTFWAERAAAAASPVRTTVPAQLPADVSWFTGRSGLLHELDASLQDGDARGVRITVLRGGPGVGKTALAVHWGHRVRQHFPDGQLHLNLQGYSASPPLRPDEALTRLLRGLGVEPDRIPRT